MNQRRNKCNSNALYTLHFNEGGGKRFGQQSPPIGIWVGGDGVSLGSTVTAYIANRWGFGGEFRQRYWPPVPPVVDQSIVRWQTHGQRPAAMSTFLRGSQHKRSAATALNNEHVGTLRIGHTVQRGLRCID